MATIVEITRSSILDTDNNTIELLNEIVNDESVDNSNDDVQELITIIKLVRWSISKEFMISPIYVANIVERVKYALGQIEICPNEIQLEEYVNGTITSNTYEDAYERLEVLLQNVDVTDDMIVNMYSQDRRFILDDNTHRYRILGGGYTKIDMLRITLLDVQLIFTMYQDMESGLVRNITIYKY
jgi:hypothetical protein